MQRDPRWVLYVQNAGLFLFTVFVFGVIGWIIRLIRLSWTLDDSPSGSIAISLIAIPVFLLLLGVVNYVFWGIRGAVEKEDSQ
ncbi:MAG: hypothetical protein HYY96_13780 [Candidatus Tectomicrobia bacterium]|nr:hypothetical protein [Candidatus Tectomicrobia bacterium]